jgi:phospholipid/cholesterol/gamma-HCH transport system substrate-binding protein
MTVTVRTRGVLGDVYLELIPGAPDSIPLRAGESFERVELGVNYQDVFKNTAEITKDLKEITEALKSYTVADKSMVANILKNMEVLTTNMASFSSKNAENMNIIVANLAALSQDLRRISSESGMDVESTLKRINAITEKIEKGEGSLGKLIVEEDTVEKTNSILEDLKTLTEPIGRLKVGLDYHLEYLGASQEYKNIVNFKLSTRPDKYFLFGVMHNTNPPPSTNTEIETFDTNGTTTVVTKETSSFDKIRFNAQLAKVFKDFTIRGGLIENTGGVAAEYNKGPFNVTLQGFNFGNPGQSLKVSGYLNLTNSIYVTGGGYFLGGTDSVSGITYGNDWFVGAGLRFTDEDVSSLLGGVGLVVP